MSKKKQDQKRVVRVSFSFISTEDHTPANLAAQIEETIGYELTAFSSNAHPYSKDNYDY